MLPGALHYFPFWAMDHQLPPEGDWRTWVVMGGRGAGKTRAGSEWVRSMVEGPCSRSPGCAHAVALVGETLEQAREVMVRGESGILACSPADRMPEFQASRNALVWPNGAEARLFSAHDPERLRGPQFDAAWVDEIAKWRNMQETWDMLQFALRTGDAPRACVTTTPRSVKLLRELLRRDTTVLTRAATEANAANLAKSYLDEVRARYDGTRLGRQELDGELLSDIDGALWSLATLEAAVINLQPRLDRIVVAVDPPAGSKASSDDCGIVVVGARMSGPPQEWRAVVLEDATVSASSPTQWAGAAIDAWKRHKADRVVAEVNQGGAMVRSVIDSVQMGVPFTAVHATRGKSARAEPVAALYEQGRVHHLRGLSALEDQMCQMTTRGFRGSGSPDRVDALVWAVTEVLLKPLQMGTGPKVRGLG